MIIKASSTHASLMERLRPLLAAEAQPVYVVGGTVRDLVLGRAIHDIDLIVAADALTLTFRLAEALHLPAYVLDGERDVGRIIDTGSDLTLDIARFRGPTLEDDLLGRDFTINALALPAGSEAIADVIDLHDGLTDLRERRIRVIHPQSISDDPIRALRAARFSAQLGFDLTEDTAAAASAAGPLLPTRASAERVRDELSRLLTSGALHLGVAQLYELGLLPHVLPAIAALDGLAQSPPHHEDVLRHTVSVLRYLVAVEQLIDNLPVAGEWGEAVAALLEPYRESLGAHLDAPTDGGFSGRTLLLWGGLLHDVGKAKTQTIDAAGRIRFLNHDEVGAEMTGQLLSAFSFSNEAVRRVRAIVAGHMRPLFLAADKRPPSRRSTYRFFRDLHEAGLDVGLLTIADHLATYDGTGDPAGWEALLVVVNSLFAAYFHEHDRIVMPPRLLDGREIMALLDAPPGHEIGRLLRLVEEAQAAGEILSRDEAVAFIRQHYSPA